MYRKGNFRLPGMSSPRLKLFIKLLGAQHSTTDIRTVSIVLVLLTACY